MNLKQIATFHSPLPEKFGIPRQSGLAPSLKGSIVFEHGLRDANALRGLEDFSHIWLIWGFSANRHEAEGVTVRPPRLGGNKALGVFATRSPYRPNPIGLSAVKIESIDFNGPEGPVIHVQGADLMDGTPIYDIKPYVPYADSIPEAAGGFTDSTPWKELKVSNPEALQEVFGKRSGALLEILRQDPRPQYAADSAKTYALTYDGHDIRFSVSGGKLEIHSVE